MKKFFTHCCAWLQQNYELASLTVLAAGVVGFPHFEPSQIFLLLSLLVGLVGGCIWIAKLRSRRSLRVPTTRGLWLIVSLAGFAVGFVSVIWPSSTYYPASVLVLLVVFSCFHERQKRYTIARARVQKRRIQQAKWRLAKRDVLDEWKERLRWLAGVQHDMRQPLHAMGLIINHPEFRKHENQKQLVKRIHSCQRWLQELAENTLEATRFELNEHRDTEISVVSSELLCSGLQTWIAQLAETKELSMLVEVEEQIIRTDTRRLKRVIGNLLFNAVEHTFEGEVSLRYRRTGGVHQFVIRDNGPGIAEAIVHTKRPIKSAFGSDLPKAGIGLYVVRKLCDEMGWNLMLNNELGGGATFVLELADQLVQEPFTKAPDGKKVSLV